MHFMHEHVRELPAPTNPEGRSLLAAALIAAGALSASPVHSAPTGGVVTAGAGAISQEGAATTIRQSASRMVIDWNSFSSAAGESVVFRQPDASSIALNRVIGASPSQLQGSLSANGQVFILNPNGVLFGPGAQVNVRGLLASTLSLDNASFMHGSQALQGASSAKVVNQGSLTAAEGGYIALVGPVVINQGAISTRLGDTLLAAADKVNLRLEGGSLMAYHIDRGSAAALVDNSAGGVISAAGGRVVLVAGAADALSKAVVNQAGVIEAHTLSSSEGSIRLIGDPGVGEVHAAGTLNASAPNGGNGGFVETSAARVKVADGARVSTLASSGKAGTWLIDPVDFEITSGSGAQTDSSIGAATLAAGLAGGNVIIATSNSGAGNGNGDINVNAGVAWGANKLTLQAQRNINFNASLRGGSVALLYGQASADGSAADYFFKNGAKIDLNTANGTFSTQKGSNPASLKDYTIVRSLGAEGSSDRSTLQGMSGLRSADNYVLGADIDATPSKDWNSGSGFEPLLGLRGTLDGLGHTIDGLYINQASTLVGLFTFVDRDASVRNLGLTNASIGGDVSVGAITGFNSGKISNSYVTGTVSGAVIVGGIVGQNQGSILNAHSAATVTGSQSTGGLAGENTAGGRISNSYATGSVTGLAANANAIDFFTGGLVGFNEATISGSYASGSADGNAGVGGLVGSNHGRIEDSFAQTSVSGISGVGGLAGVSDSGALIRNSYATGKVTGTDKVTTGGLVGVPGGAGTGAQAGIVSNSYWNTDLVGGTGQTAPGAGEGRTGGQLQQAATFSGWDITTTGGTDKVWRIYAGQGMPLLRTFLAPLELGSARDATYNGTVQQNQAIPTVVARTGIAASGRNVGIYQPSSNQQGYDLSGGELVITPRPLAITAIVSDKMYDGTTRASATLSDNRVAGDSLATTYQSISFVDKDAGTQKSVKLSGIAVSGQEASNYVYNHSAVGIASITPKPLVISANPDSKVFDGRPYQGGNGVSYSGFVPGETATALGGQLRYGGDAQGAVGVGTYRITPGGLGSANYASTFADGALTVQAAPRSDGTPVTPLTPAFAEVAPVIATVFAASAPRLPLPVQLPARRGAATGQLRVLDCGITLPEDILLGACGPEEQAPPSAPQHSR